jgi:hypothetical protein
MKPKDMELRDFVAALLFTEIRALRIGAPPAALKNDASMAWEAADEFMHKKSKRDEASS